MDASAEKVCPSACGKGGRHKGRAREVGVECSDGRVIPVGDGALIDASKHLRAQSQLPSGHSRYIENNCQVTDRPGYLQQHPVHQAQALAPVSSTT